MKKAIGRWAVVAIGVPLAAAGARRLSGALEKRRGSNRATRLLHRSADMLQRSRRPSRRSRFRRW